FEERSARRSRPRSPAPIGGIEQHGHASPCGHGEVGEAIAIEICHRNGGEKGRLERADSVLLGDLEAAVAVAQPNAHDAITMIIVAGRDEVEMAVTVEVPDR